jgi:hypothetical protein
MRLDKFAAMSFSKTLLYAHPLGAPTGFTPDFNEHRSLKNIIVQNFHENKAGKMAIILRVTQKRGLCITMTMTDAPEPEQEFPYRREIVAQRPVENFKSNLREFGAGQSKEVGFEIGMMMTRREFHKKKSLFTPYENVIRSGNLLPVKPV